MVVHRDEAERHGIVGRAFQIAAGKYPRGLAVNQTSQQKRRIAGGRSCSAITLAHRGQVKAADHHQRGSRKAPFAAAIRRSMEAAETRRAISWVEIAKLGTAIFPINPQETLARYK